MEADLNSGRRESPRSTQVDSTDGTSILDACAWCQRVVSLNNAAGDFEDMNVCGDCKVLLLETFGTPIRDNRRRRTTRARRARYNSSESVETLFSQQFSSMINLSRQQQNTREHDTQSVDTAGGRSMQRTSSRTTPIGSGRWRRVLSDTESDGVDSLYGETESNVSFNGFISMSGYGEESDASADGHSIMDSDFFFHSGAGNYLDNDTDIDPMHAGVHHWDSDDQDEEGEDDNDNEWEEGDPGGNTAHSLGVRLHLPLPSRWHRPFRSPESELRIRERRRTDIPRTFPNLEESELHYYDGNPSNFLDAMGFEELIENLADADGSGRGAPPAAVSYVKSLPSLVISDDQEKQDGLVCAICKDSLTAGTVVNQLPCSHLYHNFCILPWLSARSTCPICRFELPTDDKICAQSQSTLGGLVVQEISQNSINDDGFSDISNINSETDEDSEFIHRAAEQRVLVAEARALECSSRQNLSRRWLFAAAAPIIGLVGIVLVMWLGSPLAEGREPIRQDSHVEHLNQDQLSGPDNQRESRRWWLF
ncbi:uncharacterized protein LOC141692410 [Apium graveolens]|uniref:uncharacterized protein LOC141692410 n=1 Tax=Apium graveolens TaxID=4045 RepID=UPI003D79FADB